MRGWRRIVVAGTVLAGPLLGLAACQATPDSRLYTLATVPPLPTATATTPVRTALTALALGTLDLPALVDRPQIVRRIDGTQVEALEFDRWAEPLADGLRSTLAADLTARLPGVTVLPVAGSAVGEGTAVLTVTVLRFDADRSGRVTLDAQWSLSPAGRAGGGKAVPHRDTVDSVAASAEPAALVVAMSQAVAAFADRVVVGMRR